MLKIYKNQKKIYNLHGQVQVLQNMSLKMLMIAESISQVPGIYVFMQINWGCKIKVQVKTPLHTALIKILNLLYCPQIFKF